MTIALASVLLLGLPTDWHGKNEEGGVGGSTLSTKSLSVEDELVGAEYVVAVDEGR